MASGFNSASEIASEKCLQIQDPYIMDCEQILTGPACENMVEQGIRDFLGSPFADSMIQNSTRGCVTICAGATLLQKLSNESLDLLQWKAPVRQQSSQINRPALANQVVACSCIRAVNLCLHDVTGLVYFSIPCCYGLCT